MKRIVGGLFLVGMLCFTGCEGSGLPVQRATRTVACDEVTSRLVAQAYVLSLPIIGRDNELIPLMKSNPGYFTEGGGAIRCMQSLGTALVQGGLASSREFSGYSATERFGSMMPEGLSHLPGEVDNSLRSYGSDMFTMGEELVWLAQVLPPRRTGKLHLL